ncbi:hypothetical protein TNCV_904081 [Trichonephila clavipes]|nr:hypothetical protein TNCV_904081 [Trichonephila clavipes]
MFNLSNSKSFLWRGVKARSSQLNYHPRHSTETQNDEVRHIRRKRRDEVWRGRGVPSQVPSSSFDWNSKTATAGSDVVQSGRPIFDDFFQHLWPYIGNNTANVVFEMVKRLWLIRIDQ